MNLFTLHISPAKIEDLKTLKNIGIKTFIESFESANTAEDMQLYLEKSFNEQIIQSELKDAKIQYYLVYKKQIPVGYLRLNFGETQNEHIHKSSLEIQRLYVLKEYQNQNIGQFLIEKAFTVAKQNNLNLVWLGVWEKNPGAIKFYKKNGFIEFDKHLFLLGTDEQTDILMKLEI